MGTMILSGISRVSLDHSGRALKPKRLIYLAFVLIIAVGLFNLVVTNASFFLVMFQRYCLGYGLHSVCHYLLRRPDLTGNQVRPSSA